MGRRNADMLSVNGRVLAAICPILGIFGLIASANADEVADLRANQELLRRRIDQLAQAQNVGSGSYFSVTPNPAAGQPAGAGSFPRSFLIPGTETSLRVGGEIRTSAVYYFTGAPVNQSPQSTTVGITGQLESIPLDRHGQ